jgi:hypothetical protein
VTLVRLGAGLLHWHIVKRVNELVHHKFAFLAFVFSTAAALLVRAIFHGRIATYILALF